MVGSLEAAAMSTIVDRIVEDLARGALSLDAACESLATEARANAGLTVFWAQRIEAELRRNRISRAAVRRLLDALDSFQSDRTMWLESSAIAPRTGPVIAAPVSKRVEERTADSPIEAAIFAFKASNKPKTVPLQWIDANAEAVDSANARVENLLSVQPGSVIDDRYRVVSHLGQGGVGQVFDAVDVRNTGEREVHVLLKLVAVNLRHEPQAFTALETAVLRAQPLIHDNIVSLYDIVQDEDRVFIVMQPLQGRWLSSLVRQVRGSGMAYEVAWPIISGIARGLAFAHKHGVVHSDLSPHAIFLTADGTPKIMGFGMIRAAPNSNESLDVLDTLTLRAYTEAYTANAWAQQGVPHPADDLYPLGVIAYEMLTGRHPFERCSLSVARQKGLMFEPIPDLNRRARKLIAHCLSFDRAIRPQSGDGFLQRMRPNVMQRLLIAARPGV
jgi:non-specific serine/threonine protein kinase